MKFLAFNYISSLRALYILPSSIFNILSAISEILGSCVTISTEQFCSFASFLIRVTISLPVTLSKAEVGSSANISFGLADKARAIATL